MPCTIQRRWCWPSSASSVASTSTGSRPHSCSCSAMTRIAAACTSLKVAPGLAGGDAGLLRGQHGLVDLALGVGEGAVDRQGAGDVGGVEGVDLDAGVDQQQVAVADVAVVADPVQGAGVVAGGGDRVVADAVAVVARDAARRRPRPSARPGPRATASGRLGDDASKPSAVAATAEPHLLDLPLVLDQPQLGQELAAARRPAALLALGASRWPRRLRLSAAARGPRPAGRDRRRRRRARSRTATAPSVLARSPRRARRCAGR